MILFHSEAAPRGSRRPVESKFTCRRCGSHKATRIPPGCPWCAECRISIARDPQYLVLSYGPDEAQRLLDQWINTRNAGPKRRRALAAAV